MPFWQAIFESRPAVQFQHRWFAYALALFAGLTAWRLYRGGQPNVWQQTALWIAGVTTIQIALGIVTLVHAAPLSLSLLHQGGAIALFVTAGWASWLAARRV